MPLANVLRSLDLQQKVHDDYRVHTKAGGIFSLLTLFFIFVLFALELAEFREVKTRDHMMVDHHVSERLRIGLTIAFPELHCSDVSVDTVDSFGENQLGIQGSMKRIFLNRAGRPSNLAPIIHKDCQPCHDASTVQKCCNSCEDLKAAYLEAGKLASSAMDRPQCAEERGCLVTGDLEVAKVSGNVHVAFGTPREVDGKHIHEFDPTDVLRGFNATHTIQRLRFGPSVPGMEAPLEGLGSRVTHGAMMYHYYIKLVPTEYVSLDGTRTYTHQYSVMKTEKDVHSAADGELSGLPGVFLVYEFSPFLVERSEFSVSLTSFLTGCASVVGGVFSVMGILDRGLWRIRG